jgi:hypothetical protein
MTANSEFGRSRWIIALAAFATTVLVRLAFLWHSHLIIDGDEAVTGIMVRNILHGHRYIYFAGQNYGGTVQQYLQAAIYYIFPLPETLFTLRLIPVILDGMTCALVYVTGCEMFGSQHRALVAAFLYALSPWFNIFYGSQSTASYQMTQLLGIAGLYIALRMTRESSKHSLSRWASLLGLTCGLGIWTGYTSAYLLIPAVLWVAPLVLRARRAAIAMVVGVAIGASPVILWCLRHHAWPVPGPQTKSSLIQRWTGLTHTVLREFLGMSWVHGLGGWPRILQTLVVVLLMCVVAVGFYRRRYGLVDLLRLTRHRRQPTDLLLLAILVTAVLYMASPNTYYTGTPRYLFAAYPLFALGLAALIPSKRYARSTFTVALVLVSTVTCFALLGPFKQTSNRDQSLQRVATYLDDKHERFVYAEYWTAMPLQYLAGNRLHVNSLTHDRFPKTSALVNQQPGAVYVVSDLNDLRARIAAALKRHHISYDVTTIGSMQVFTTIGEFGKPSWIFRA